MGRRRPRPAGRADAASPYPGTVTATPLLDPDRIVVLDGGLGTHLAARGNDVTDDLWSARILRDRPEEVRAAHVDFFRSGAEVATSCSYQVTFDGLAAAGASRTETEELLRASVRLAREASEEIAGDPAPRWVAASVGPYGAGPGRGTEYDGDYGLDVAALRSWHRPRLEVLAEGGADVLLAETIPSVREVEALAFELAAVDAPALLSVTVGGDRLRDGTALTEVAGIVQDSPTIRAVGVNCCDPADAILALGVLGAAGVPLLAYPNIGEVWDARARRWTGSRRPGPGILEVAPALATAGARLIGGCCGVTPRHITQIASGLRAPGTPGDVAGA